MRELGHVFERMATVDMGDRIVGEGQRLLLDVQDQVRIGVGVDIDPKEALTFGSATSNFNPRGMIA